jgi:hypothetical protein
MMITAETVATSGEICALVGFSKQRLGALERDGVIRRSGQNAWPLVETIGKLFEHARAQRSAISESRARFEAARAKREEQRAEREANRAQRKRDDEFDLAWRTCWYVLVSKLVAVPARCSRDAAVRATIERELDVARNEVCNEFERQSEALAQTGEAAPVR